MGRWLEVAWEWPAIGVAPLVPLSWLYSAGWRSYQAVYGLGLRTAFRPEIPSLVIGNLRVGGTGKTPLVRAVCSLLEQGGRQVVVSASGYGSPAEHGASLAPPGPLIASVWGDEPALLRTWLPDVPLVIGRDRLAAAKIAAREFPARVLVMDDGYQHLRVRADLSIVVDPPSRRSFCLPAGPFREPRGAGRRRADLVLPNPGWPYELVWSATDASTDAPVSPAPVDVLTAVARPERLLAALHDRGFQVGRVCTLPDHAPMDRPSIWNGLGADRPVMVTGKDWVKLREYPSRWPRSVWRADYTWQFESAVEFAAWLNAQLDGTHGQSTGR